MYNGTEPRVYGVTKSARPVEATSQERYDKTDMENVTYRNPILRGFRPDPSFCFVGDDCYLVNSTFEFFPGVPVWHSRDLIRWQQIGACLTRGSQLDLRASRISGGIFAPTIRYHNGRFYMITTNTSSKGNFFVYTDDIRGEWSEPVWIDHRGIDPSLFFDEDERVYYCGTADDPNGKAGIVLFQIDIKTGGVIGDKRIISHGITGKYPEGPHLYKINDWYYLMMAEGGTEYGHTETIFRSRDIAGPYESCPFNPILTNRDEMYNQIQCCGHADIAQDGNGNWWMVCLGIRRLLNGPLLHNLGRETFLAPVTWEDGWPRVAGDGIIRETMNGPLPQGETERPGADFSDNFSSAVLAPEWTFVRNTERGRFHVESGRLRIRGSSDTLNDYEPAFVGIRQTEFEMEAEVAVTMESTGENARAGLCVYYSKENHYELYLQWLNGKLYAALSRKIMDLEAVTGRLYLENIADGPVTLRVRADASAYVFSIVGKGGESIIGTGCTAGLCTEGTVTMTFTGAFIGLFAVDTAADFRSFRLVAR